jgi:hypothetical protein
MPSGQQQIRIDKFDDLFTLQEVGASRSEGNGAAQLLEFQ